MKLSVIIPVRNEGKNIEATVTQIVKELTVSGVSHEILVVNDGSTDGTEAVLKKLSQQHATVRYVNNRRPHGFGFAVRCGLEHFNGEAAVIVMGDGSDDPRDIVRYHEKLNEGYDCVFGSRFMKGSFVGGYPLVKLIINRIANYLIKCIFLLNYNDTTNAFKCYRREVIEGIKPLTAGRFNLTVEMPLKAVVRGYRYTVISISWIGRAKGISKFKIKEIGSSYLSTIAQVFF